MISTHKVSGSVPGGLIVTVPNMVESPIGSGLYLIPTGSVEDPIGSGIYIVPDPLYVTHDYSRVSVIDAAITLDEGWSPYIQASLTCWTPPEIALDALDPRNDARLTLELRQEFGNGATFAVFNANFAGKTFADFNAYYAPELGRTFNLDYFTAYNAFGVREPVSRVLDLIIRARTVDHETGTMTLDLSSDEGLLQDFAPVGNAALVPSTATVQGAVTFALGKIGAALTTSPATAIPVTNPDALLWQPGVTAWDYLRSIIDSAGLRLWCDEDRAWHLGEPIDGSLGALALSAAHNVTKATDAIDRERGGWYDAVQVTYKWKDALGVLGQDVGDRGLIERRTSGVVEMSRLHGHRRSSCPTLMLG